MKSYKKEILQEITNLSKNFAFITNNVTYIDDNITIINKVSLAIHHSETLVITGLSGSGKTTLLKLLYGLLYPTQGEVLINGNNTNFLDLESILEITKDMLFIFQYGSLINNLSVFDNLALANKYYSFEDEKKIEEKILKQLDFFELKHRKDVRPAQLTLNEKKLVSFSKILLRDYNAIFMDDPFSSVDETAIRKMSGVIKRLKKEKKTIIISTTNINYAYQFADKIGIIDNGEMIFLGNINEIKNIKNKELIDIIKKIDNNLEDNIEMAEEL